MVLCSRPPLRWDQPGSSLVFEARGWFFVKSERTKGTNLEPAPEPPQWVPGPLSARWHGVSVLPLLSQDNPHNSSFKGKLWYLAKGWRGPELSPVVPHAAAVWSASLLVSFWSSLGFWNSCFISEFMNWISSYLHFHQNLLTGDIQKTFSVFLMDLWNDWRSIRSTDSQFTELSASICKLVVYVMVQE